MTNQNKIHPILETQISPSVTFIFITGWIFVIIAMAFIACAFAFKSDNNSFYFIPAGLLILISSSTFFALHGILVSVIQIKELLLYPIKKEIEQHASNDINDAKSEV